MGPYTLLGFNSSTTLGTSVPTATSSPVLTLIGTSPGYATNKLYLFGQAQNASYDTYISVYTGPSGSQQLLLENAAHGNGNPLGFSEEYTLGRPIPPNTEIWVTALYVGGSAGSINISVGVAWEEEGLVRPVQFLGASVPPGTSLTSGAANVMGAWVTLGTVTWLSKRLKIHFAPPGNNYNYALFIGRGASPSAPEITIPFNAEAGYAYQDAVNLPIILPPGTIISAALQCTTASTQCAAFAHAY